eukprot:COSAG04_NODE_186_length_21024_cov_6.326069_15_plen_1166_part_00
MRRKKERLERQRREAHQRREAQPYSLRVPPGSAQRAASIGSGVLQRGPYIVYDDDDDEGEGEGDEFSDEDELSEDGDETMSTAERARLSRSDFYAPDDPGTWMCFRFGVTEVPALVSPRWEPLVALGLLVPIETVLIGWPEVGFESWAWWSGEAAAWRGQLCGWPLAVALLCLVPDHWHFSYFVGWPKVPNTHFLGRYCISFGAARILAALLEATVVDSAVDSCAALAISALSARYLLLEWAAKALAGYAALLCFLCVRKGLACSGARFGAFSRWHASRVFYAFKRVEAKFYHSCFLTECAVGGAIAAATHVPLAAILAVLAPYIPTLLRRFTEETDSGHRRAGRVMMSRHLLQFLGLEGARLILAALACEETKPTPGWVFSGSQCGHRRGPSEWIEEADWAWEHPGEERQARAKKGKKSTEEDETDVHQNDEQEDEQEQQEEQEQDDGEGNQEQEEVEEEEEEHGRQAKAEQEREVDEWQSEEPCSFDDEEAGLCSVRDKTWADLSTLGLTEAAETLGLTAETWSDPHIFERMRLLVHRGQDMLGQVQQQAASTLASAIEAPAVEVVCMQSVHGPDAPVSAVHWRLGANKNRVARSTGLLQSVFESEKFLESNAGAWLQRASDDGMIHWRKDFSNVCRSINETATRNDTVSCVDQCLGSWPKRVARNLTDWVPGYAGMHAQDLSYCFAACVHLQAVTGLCRGAPVALDVCKTKAFELPEGVAGDRSLQPEDDSWDLPAWQFWLITIVVCNVAAAITEDFLLHLMYVTSEALETEYEWGERRFFLRKHEQTRQGLVPRQILQLLSSPLVLLEHLHGPVEAGAMSAGRVLASACGFLLHGGLAFVSGVLDLVGRLMYGLATAFHWVGQTALSILGIIWWPVRFARWLADGCRRCCYGMRAGFERRQQRKEAERAQAAAEAERRAAEQKVLEAQQATEKAKREEEERRAAERQEAVRVKREAREAREQQEWARLQAEAEKQKEKEKEQQAQRRREAEKQKEEGEGEEEQDDYAELRRFLAEQNLTKLTEKLVENEVTFDCLLHLEEDDLKELGVAKGPRVKLLRTMHSHAAAAKPGAAPAPAPARRRASSASGQPPDEFCCPITQELMLDPVLVVASGQTYERTEIAKWFRTHKTDPSTGSSIGNNRKLVPNVALRKAIDEWREQHQ